MGYKLSKIIATLSLATLFAAGCGEARLGFSPPLLINNAGLAGEIEIDPTPLAYGDVRDSQLSGQAPFGGYIFASSAGAVISLSLSAQDAGVAPALVLYGPRAQDGLFGMALRVATAAAGGQAVLWDLPITKSGDYLVLAAAAGASGGRSRLQLDCSSGCSAPGCPALACGIYCPAGLARDSQACPVCTCTEACTADSDCPGGFACEDGSCVRRETCECNQPYDPVCGTDGLSYANQCELDCAGVALDHAGDCGKLPCAANADCPAGMLCENGDCRAACDCSNAGYNPVCGTDGVSYPNDCERQCAAVGLAHLGSCEQCNPEICDGIDNDCDGQIDEGVCSTCSTDADCASGQICWAGTCVGEIRCSADADCPAGQVCQDGVCRGQTDCEPEVCDGLDNDCDGQTDEGCPACQADADCAAGLSCCEGLCIGTLTDPANCGGCGHACGAGQACSNGVCTAACTADSDCSSCDSCQAGTCQPSGSDADGDGFCRDDCDDSDASINPGAPEICDGRDNDCDGQVDEGCPACQADSDCAAGQSCCNAQCVDTLSDDANCGGCGLACGAGESCSNGTCRPDQTCSSDIECDDGDAQTADYCSNAGYCIHLAVCAADSDCSTGQMCSNGVCLGSGQCSSDADCQAGFACTNGICAIYCRDDSDCQADQVCSQVGGFCAP